MSRSNRGSKHCQHGPNWLLAWIVRFPLPCHSVFDHGAGLREVQCCCTALVLPIKSQCFTSEVSIIKAIEAVWQGLKRLSLATHTIYHGFHLGNANVSLFSLFLWKSQKRKCGRSIWPTTTWRRESRQHAQIVRESGRS